LAPHNLSKERHVSSALVFPPHVPRLVEEWLSKIPSNEEQSSAETNKDSEALNLSTKKLPPPPSRPRSSSASVGVSKTTQVYLRPIPTPPKLSPAMTETSPKARSAHGGGNAATVRPVLLNPYSPSSSPYSSPSPSSPGRQAPVPPPSSSSLDATRSEHVNKPLTPSALHLENLRARALRDVQLAHTKDMHGN